MTRPPAAPAVRARGVAKAFGRGPAVLRVAELELAGPGLVLVEGPNGAGKSTLLRLLAGVTRPTRGRVEWTGAGRAFVPERFRATGALRAGQLLSLAGAEALLGVAELTRRPMAALSQGQAQRVALAAALGRPAAVVVLDEPFTALDAAAAGELERLLAAHTGCAAYGVALGTLASARTVARPGVAFAALAAFAIAAVPLFDLAPALSPAAWTAEALLDGRAVAAPALALAVHAAAAVALAAWALRRTA